MSLESFHKAMEAFLTLTNLREQIEYKWGTTTKGNLLTLSKVVKQETESDRRRTEEGVHAALAKHAQTHVLKVLPPLSREQETFSIVDMVIIIPLIVYINI